MNKKFITIGILSTIFLLSLYVFQVNAEVSERYSVRDYQEKIDKISEENKNLEIKEAEANSLDDIIALVKPLNFEKTDKIYYIRALDDQMVVK